MKEVFVVDSEYVISDTQGMAVFTPKTYIPRVIDCGTKVTYLDTVIPGRVHKIRAGQIVLHVTDGSLKRGLQMEVQRGTVN